MASCENCKKPVLANEVMVAERGSEKILIGPCCLGAPIEPQVNYHFELSSKRGLVATLELGGFSLQYKKSPEELRQAFSPAEMQPLQDPTQYQH